MLAIFAGLVVLVFSLGVLIFSLENILGIGIFNAILIILNGALLIIAFVPYYYALNKEDASVVVPLYQTIPIFTFVLGYLVLKETVTLVQLIAGVFIIIGAMLISLDLSKTKLIFKGKAALLMLLSSLLVSVHFLVFKIVALQENFWRTVFWEYLGAVLVALVLLAFKKNYRRQFVSAIKENSFFVILINVFDEIVNITAKLFTNYASLLVPVVVVNLANGLQPMFVFGLASYWEENC